MRAGITLSQDLYDWHNYFPPNIYVKKNTTIDNALFDMLKDGKKKPLVLKVKYVTDDSGPRRDPYLTITKVVRTNFSKY